MRWLVVALMVGSCGDDDPCPHLRTEVASILATPQSCTQDSDCVYVTLNCGLPGGCGASVNATSSASLEPIVESYEVKCGTSACVPCTSPFTPACVEHVCGAAQ